MKLMVHVFKKDVRHLWWAAAGSLALLGTLARQDAWRSDYMPGSIEGWLNVIVPFAWVCLLGLAVEQDPLVGDRQFWITRPHRRIWLLGAKLLFAAVFIHAASFLADCYILAARGFSPLHSLPHLLWKQALLAGAVTLPALALASLFRNFTQFMLAVLCLMAVIVIVTGAYQIRRPYWRVTDGGKLGVVLAVACFTGVLVTALQFLRRKTAGSRAIGLVSAAAATVVYAWLPLSLSWALLSETSPSHPPLAIELRTGLPDWRTYWTRGPQSISIPFAISGIPAGHSFAVEPLELEIVAANGERFQWRPRRQDSYEQRPIESFVMGADPEAGKRWITIQMDRKLYDRLNAGSVTIRGKEGVILSAMGASHAVPAVGTSLLSAGLHCTGTPTEDRWSILRLKFECESPDAIERYTWAKLSIPGNAPPWVQPLGEFDAPTQFVRGTWLSPLNRRQAAISLIPRAAILMEFPGLAEALQHAQVIVTQEPVTGYSLLGFEFKNLRLQDYVARPSPPKP
jgi:hypothetical protein